MPCPRPVYFTPLLAILMTRPHNPVNTRSEGMAGRMRASVRDEKAVLRVIDLCALLEEKALGIYEFLHRNADTERLRGLWATLIADEQDHRQYWLRLKKVCADGAVPEVFEEPRRYVDELETLQLRLEHAESQLREDYSAPKVFIHALRIEFLLLHPSFVTLFHYLPEDPGLPSPSRTYEQHLGRLLSAIMDYQEMTPELELLGEAIGQVWKKTAEGITKAVTDFQTGTLNRRGLHIAMRPLACLARRDRETAGVMFIEISNLKDINESRGYPAGDALLSTVAGAISSRIRSSDVVGRYGGDDFMALLTRFDPRHFERIAREVIHRVEEASSGELKPSLAVGGAFASMEGPVQERLEALMHAADTALDESRTRGGDCVIRSL